MRFLKQTIKLVITLSVACTTIAICFSIFFIFFVIIVMALVEVGNHDNYQTIFGSKDSDNMLLSVKVDGVIMGDKDSSVFGSLQSNTISGYNIKSQLIAAAKDKGIKGVILEVSSPGGTIFGARAITDGVTYYKNTTHKPVYAFISGLGASGGYMASVTSDKIVADYGSSIGSIGIIYGPFEYYDKVLSESGGLFGGDVLTENGIQQITFTAGKFKDFGNPYRKMTQDEIDATQKTVDNEYANFVNLVSTNRNIAKSTITDTIGALVYDNKTAQAYHLIDATMNREQTYQALANQAGVANDFRVVREDNGSSFVGGLLGSFSHIGTSQALKACSTNAIALAYRGDITQLCQ